MMEGKALDPGRLLRLAAAGMTIALASACGSTPKERFYTLAAPPPIEAGSAAATSIHVGPVSLPEAIDRTPMVVRTGPNQVDIEDFHRWAEPLKAAIPRVLAAHLGRELGARTSWSRGGASGADWRVTVEVGRFESSFAEGATVEASWTVTPKGGAPVHGRTLARAAAPSADHSGIAGAHSRALEQLAREIAAAIARAPSTPRPAARGG